MPEIMAGTYDGNRIITLGIKCFQPIIFHKAMRKPTNAKTAITAITISNEFGLLDFPMQPPRRTRRKPNWNPGVKPKIQKS